MLAREFSADGGACARRARRHGSSDRPGWNRSNLGEAKAGRAIVTSHSVVIVILNSGAADASGTRWVEGAEGPAILFLIHSAMPRTTTATISHVTFVPLSSAPSRRRSPWISRTTRDHMDDTPS
jgi:hypothetical protein